MSATNADIGMRRCPVEITCGLAGGVRGGELDGGGGGMEDVEGDDVKGSARDGVGCTVHTVHTWVLAFAPPLGHAQRDAVVVKGVVHGTLHNNCN